MRRPHPRCSILLVCVLSLLLSCTPQVLGDDATMDGRGEEAAVDLPQGVIDQEGGDVDPSVALDGVSEEISTDPGGEADEGVKDAVMSPDERQRKNTTRKDAEGAGDRVEFDPQNIIICAFFMGNPQGAHLEQLSQMFHSARFAHGPRSRLMVVTDEESQFQVDKIHKDLEIMRFTIDEEKFKYHIGSSKSKNHLSLMPKRVAFESFLLERLNKEGNKTNVVFVDTDLLFLRSVSDIFSSNDFDVAMTFNDI